MESETEKQNLVKQPTFPAYLPTPDEAILKWIGDSLKKSRKKKTLTEVARAAKVEVQTINDVENGIIRQSLGTFRQILRRGYGLKLDNILGKCYSAFDKKFNPPGRRQRRFLRDYYFSICLKNVGKHPPTPFLVGGDSENFLWAVPFRKLTKQPLSVDLLELAPSRIRKHLGATPGGSHDGAEVIHVINGTIDVEIDTDEDDPKSRTIKRGDSIYLNSTREHSITNLGNTSSALLLVVRLPEIHKGKIR